MLSQQLQAIAPKKTGRGQPGLSAGRGCRDAHRGHGRNDRNRTRAGTGSAPGLFPHQQQLHAEHRRASSYPSGYNSVPGYTSASGYPSTSGYSSTAPPPKADPVGYPAASAGAPTVARPRILLVGSTIAAIVVVGIAVLAVGVAIGIKPVVSQQAVRSDESVPGRGLSGAPWVGDCDRHRHQSVCAAGGSGARRTARHRPAAPASSWPAAHSNSPAAPATSRKHPLPHRTRRPCRMPGYPMTARSAPVSPCHSRRRSTDSAWVIGCHRG